MDDQKATSEFMPTWLAMANTFVSEIIALVDIARSDRIVQMDDCNEQNEIWRDKVVARLV
jgi:hypothetical protein